MDWDPTLYARYEDERSRPFLELIARIGAERPRRVVDLGCGTGVLTALLATRWPQATVEGIDSSAEMVAQAVVPVRLERIEDWTYPPDADVVVSNAALQWVPTHRDVLARWARQVPEGGWLAWQVPGNFDAPSHSLMRSIAQQYGAAGVLRHADMMATPSDNVRLLLDASLRADVWESTYIHVLHGPDPVLEWVRGTGLRPVLAALQGAALEGFLADYAAALRQAYPMREDGSTLLPYRRLFAVGHRS